MTNTRYHPDVRGYAVNVKTLHMHFADGGTEPQRELAWDSTHEDWWNAANEIARQEGFDGAAACGRSCGWCAPFYVNKRTLENRSDHYVYVQWAEGNEEGNPDFDEDEAKRFGKFAERIEEHLKEVPAMYKQNLERIIAEDAEAEQETERAAEEAHEMKFATIHLLEVAAQGITPYIKMDEAKCLADYWRKQWGLAK